ncbi:MAG TPA: YHYH domain-containing protein [Thermoanaerobaculia bacterium]|nr:YHYH domain-containing protein [Thermoanaerobaculia bacterium]
MGDEGMAVADTLLSYAWREFERNLVNRMKPIAVMFVLVFAVVLFRPGAANGHGGGLDKNGCHTNRKTGDYHCHGAPAPSPAPTRSEPPPSAPIAPRAAASTLLSVQPSAQPSEKDLVKAAQVLLDALGYRPSLLGSLDVRTQTAIRAFQRDQSIEPVGVVNQYLVLRLAQALANKCR